MDKLRFSSPAIVLLRVFSGELLACYRVPGTLSFPDKVINSGMAKQETWIQNLTCIEFSFGFIS